MCRLCRIQIVLIFTCFLVSQSCFGQINRHSYNYNEFSSKPYYFGLSLGFNYSKYQVFRGDNFTNSPSIARAEGISVPGFNVNVIGNLKIGQFFDFRFLPGFSFTERSIEFNRQDLDLVSTKKLESVFFEAPFHIRYKSAPYKDKRAFVVAGLKYSYDVASNSEARRANELIRISPHDFQIEVGAGMQFFFPYYIFAPEIKFSQSLNNILIFNNDLEEARIMEKILSRILTISFSFEG